MRKLKIIGSKHHDHQRKRGMDLNPLSQTLPSISARSERIFPNCAAAVQTILDDSHVLAGIAKLIFEHARPALIKGKSIPGLGDDSPAYRVAVDQYVVHEGLLQSLCRELRLLGIALHPLIGRD